MTKTTEIDKFAHDLTWDNGIWHAADAEAVSYPGNDHDLYFDIEAHSFWFGHRNAVILAALKRYALAGPVLDVGGGNGFVSAFLEHNGFETVLVEPVRAGCENARKRGLKRIINARFDSLSFHLGRVPNVGIFDVLEHVATPERFLREIHGQLAENGRLFITVPAWNWLWSAEDRHAGHFRRYSKKRLACLVSAEGFDVQYASYFFSFLVPPILFFRAMPSRLGFYKVRPRSVQRQHGTGPWPGRFLQPLFRHELARIRRGRSLPLGSSVLLVAGKK